MVDKYSQMGDMYGKKGLVSCLSQSNQCVDATEAKDHRKVQSSPVGAEHRSHL